MRFLEYEMHNSNECKRNFVAIYDGSSSVEHLKNKFCSTVANDVMLVSSVGVVRLWADEGSRKSKFRILFTTFHEREGIAVSSIYLFVYQCVQQYGLSPFVFQLHAKETLSFAIATCASTTP